MSIPCNLLFHIISYIAVFTYNILLDVSDRKITIINGFINFFLGINQKWNTLANPLADHYS